MIIEAATTCTTSGVKGAVRCEPYIAYTSVKWG